MKKDDNLGLDKEVIRILSRRSDYKGLVQLTGHLALLMLTTFLVAHSSDTWLFAAVLVHGVVLTFVFSPLHETIHFTAFETRGLNNLVASIFGFLLLLPYQYFRAFHYAHHRHTQNPDKDPELIDKKPYTQASLAWHITGLPFWWVNLKSIYRHAMGRVDESYLESSDHKNIIIEARWYLMAYSMLLIISLFTGNDWLWWYWLLPALLGQPFLRLFLLAEHKGCDLTDDMLQNSRTTYTSPLVNFLAWNMPYHAEHHFLASIPFHALPALHAYTGQQVKTKGEGYYRVIREVISQAKG